MDVTEMRRKIASFVEVAQSEIPKATPEEAKLAVLVVAGIELLGELLLDIKRTAVASERIAAAANR